MYNIPQVPCHIKELGISCYGCCGSKFSSKEKIEESELILPCIDSDTNQKNKLYDKIKTLSPTFTPEKHRIVLINPNASELLPQRRWMPDYFETVIRQLVTDFQDCYVLITGAPAEQVEAEVLSQKN